MASQWSSSRFSRRRIVAAAAAPLGAAGLAACTPWGTPPPALQARGGTLSFMTWGGDPERMTAYTAMARSLETAHPAYRVQLLPPAGGNYFDRLIAMTAAGEALDVVGAGSPVWVPPLATRGVYVDLTERANRDRTFRTTDYAGGIVDGGSYQKKLYAIIISPALNVLYYNKDAFDKQSLAYPDATWTWDRLLDAARRLTIHRGDTVEQYGLSAGGDLLNVLYWIWSNGGEIFDRQEDPTRSTMTNPRTLEGVQVATDLRTRHKVIPTQSGFAFQSGNIAMGLLNVASIANITVQAQFQWDVAPRPRGPRGNFDRIGGELYGVAATSKLPDGAWELWKTVVGPVGGREFMNLNIVPTLKSLHREFEALRPPPASRKTLTDALNGLRAIPKTPKALEIYTPIYTNQFSAAFRGEKTVQEACSEIDRQVNAILSSP